MSNYAKLVESIVDQLLTEIIKANLGFGDPVSTNARYGALFGDIIKDAREKGKAAGLKHADKLNIVPMGGGGASLKGSIDFLDVDDNAKSLAPTIYLGLPHKDTGGIPAAKQNIAHEVGHWHNGDVEQIEKDPKTGKVEIPKLTDQQQLEKEVKATASGRHFAAQAGIEIDPDHDQANLNTYRRGVTKAVPLSPEAAKRDASMRDADTRDLVAIYKNEFDVGAPTSKPVPGRVVSGKKIYRDTNTHRGSLLRKLTFP